MRALFRKSVADMAGYVPGEQPQDGARVIKLNTNENPYPPSPRVVEALHAELGPGAERLRLYSDPAAMELRREASRQTGLPIEKILHGNGSDELLSLLIRGVLEEGESVAFPYPTYSLYETLAATVGAPIRTVDFSRDFRLPLGLAETGSRLVFVASPNSPSGNSHPVEVLRELAGRVPGLLVVDEAYADFASSSALELLAECENVVVLRTFSKSYSLAGLRVGLLFASAEVVAQLGKLKDSYNLDRLAICGAAAALSDQAHMRENVRKICATRDRLQLGLERLGFEVLPSEANFVFARLANAELARSVFQDLKARGILVRYFPARLLDDGLRVTVGRDEEIDELLAALGELL